MSFSIGLDLGQRRDNSALVIVEKPETQMPFLRPEDLELRVRLAERIPLGTPYPEVVEIVRHVENLPAMQGQRVNLTVDATGLGRPVVEMLRRAQLRSWITAVTITSGDKENRRVRDGGDSVNVPKRDLIAGVQVRLEKGQLRIAKGIPEAGTLVRELLDVRMTGTASGGLRIGADGYGQHDDLAIALALGVWRIGRG